VSLLAAVLDETRRGHGADAIAARLGVERGLVDAAVDHWVRVGAVTRAGDLLGCGGCGAGGGASDAPGVTLPACRGCPVAPGAAAPRAAAPGVPAPGPVAPWRRALPLAPRGRR
jgi:hypothetical protein